MTLDGSDGYVTSDTPFSARRRVLGVGLVQDHDRPGRRALAQSSVQTGAGGTTDRAITMDNNGDLSFALAGRGINFRNQDTIWNDGQWHQVVGTYDGNSTLSLYVDGGCRPHGDEHACDATRCQRSASGYLRAGYADMSGIQVRFGINFYSQVADVPFFNGSLDEVSA